MPMRNGPWKERGPPKRRAAIVAGADRREMWRGGVSVVWMMDRAFLGGRRERGANLTDASLVEAAPLALMVVTIIGVGVWPSLLTDVFESGLNPMVDVLNGVINK